MKHEAGAVRAP